MSVQQACPYTTLLLETALGSFGRFRCAAGASLWNNVNTIGPRALMAFPRVPVKLRSVGHEAIFADPTCITLYNPFQQYRRWVVSGRGDECEWFSPSTALLEVALREDGAASLGADPERPFLRPSIPGSGRVYLRQRRLDDALAADAAPPDPLWVDETLVELVRYAVCTQVQGAGQPRRRKRRDTVSAHAQLAEDAKAWIAPRATTPLHVDEIARGVHSSPYHLCRVFRERTGLTLHGYIVSLRLHASLDPLAEGCSDLARLALDLGFSSHAHFTAAFKAAFGAAPGAVREATRSARRAMSNRLIARGAA